MPGNIRPVSRPAALFLFLYCLGFPLWAAPKAEEAPVETLNKEWVLVVTAFDAGALPPEHSALAGLVQRDLVESFKAVRYRIRSEAETAYYRDYAWQKAVEEAAAALAAKQKSRDELLFRGDRPWKYRRDLRNIDVEIEQLNAAFREAEKTMPLIEPQPVFKLAELSGLYPAPPEPGKEYAFCRSRNADAFLCGSISEFHGRIYVSVRVYALYAQDYIYEDYVLFSPDNRTALDSLALSLGAFAAGTEPVQVVINTEPPDAVVTVDSAFAGSEGQIVLQRFPGELSVEAFSMDYRPSGLSAELKPGENTEIFLNLSPLLKNTFSIAVRDSQAALYLGALYVGEAPLSLSVSEELSHYVMAETPDGRRAQLVFRGQGGQALLSPQPYEIPESQSVKSARRKFYGAFGRFWVSLSAAVLLSGMAQAYTNGYNLSFNESLYTPAVNYNTAATVSFGLVGCFLVESVVRFIIYTRSAERPPIEMVR